MGGRANDTRERGEMCERCDGEGRWQVKNGLWLLTGAVTWQECYVCDGSGVVPAESRNATEDGA